MKLIKVIITATPFINHMQDFIKYEYHRCGNMYKVMELHAELRSIMANSGFPVIKEVQFSSQLLFQAEESGLPTSIAKVSDLIKQEQNHHEFNKVSHFISASGGTQPLTHVDENLFSYLRKISSIQDTWVVVDVRM
jgi:hypothetical protein